MNLETRAFQKVKNQSSFLSVTSKILYYYKKKSR